MTTHRLCPQMPCLETEASLDRKAFTLTELLVVIASAAFLALLAAPALARSGEKSKRIQCLSNLKQFGLAIQLYGSEYQGKLPSEAAGNWAWDIPTSIADQLVNRGAPRPVMYDPAFPEQNNNTLWNYGSYHVIGYALTLPGTPSVASTNQNASLFPKPITSGPITYPAPLPAERPLLACATISTGNNLINRESNNYTKIFSGWSQPHRSAHLNVNGNLPSGGNVGMLDGSVRWVKFAAMLPRTISAPYFWW